jgi:osmoprotectant transport system permease protein
VAVELPLASPLIAAGLRTAVVQVAATIPLAAFVGGGGLGVPLRAGIATQRYGQVLACGLIIAALCLLLDIVGALVQYLATAPPLRHKGLIRTMRVLLRRRLKASDALITDNRLLTNPNTERSS